MQRGVGNGGTGKAHRLHHCLGSQYSGPDNLHNDIHNAAGLFLGRILVGNGPAGRLGGAAHDISLGKLIELYYRSVHFIRKRIAVIAYPLNMLNAVLDVIE